MTKTYSLKACGKLIESYVLEHNGSMLQLEEGTLGLGTILLHGAEGKCSILIRERYLNPWASTHTIRQMKKLPKKYLSLIETL